MHVFSYITHYNKSYDDFAVAAIQQYKAGPFAYLVSLYGPQSHGMMLSLFLCLITTIILSATTAVTHVVLVCS